MIEQTIANVGLICTGVALTVPFDLAAARHMDQDTGLGELTGASVYWGVRALAGVVTAVAAVVA